MTITKKDLITLLRDDMKYQRNDLTPSLDTVFKINGLFIYNNIFTRTKVVFDEYSVDFGMKLFDGTIAVFASISYTEITSVGYLYGDSESIKKRLTELRNN